MDLVKFDNLTRKLFRGILTTTMIRSLFDQEYSNVLWIIPAVGLLFLISRIYTTKCKPPLASAAMPLFGHTMMFLKNLDKSALILSYVANTTFVTLSPQPV
jgi:hypothetical protein